MKALNPTLTFKYEKITVWNHYSFISDVSKNSIQHSHKAQSGKSASMYPNFDGSVSLWINILLPMHGHKYIFFFIFWSTCLNFSLCEPFVQVTRVFVERKNIYLPTWRAFWERVHQKTTVSFGMQHCYVLVVSCHFFWKANIGLSFLDSGPNICIASGQKSCTSYVPFYNSLRPRALEAPVPGLLIALLFSSGEGLS